MARHEQEVCQSGSIRPCLGQSKQAELEIGLRIPRKPLTAKGPVLLGREAGT